MTEQQIRELFDLGVEDAVDGDVEGVIDQTWNAGRRERRRGMAWAGAAVAGVAAAAIGFAVWGPGILDSDAVRTPEPAQTFEGSLDTLRGAPYAVSFVRGEHIPQPLPPSGTAGQVSGRAEAATLEDLQGRWTSEDRVWFEVDGDRFTLTARCETVSGTVSLSESGVLTSAEWDTEEGAGLDCDGPDEDGPGHPTAGWSMALANDPVLSLDGEVAVMSGLSVGTAEDEERVHVAMTLEPAGTPTGLTEVTDLVWTDTDARTGVTPVRLGEDLLLVLSGGVDSDQRFISEVIVEERSQATADERNLCPYQYATTLRSDDTLVVLADQGRFTGCDPEVPAVQVDPVVHALLTGLPTVSIEQETMIISGTVPAGLAP